MKRFTVPRVLIFVPSGPSDDVSGRASLMISWNTSSF